jgi:Zn-dependent peptidase ImmA (M78 family)/transcriptional regulator with XRE-family HTH domain
MKMDGINPQMVVLARESRGMNQGHLAGEIGISGSNLAKIENAEIGASPERINDIAEATDYPLHFFMQKGSAVMPENLAWRKRRKVPQKALMPVYAKANIIRRHVELLSNALQTEKVKLPLWKVSDRMTPQKIAAKLRAQWSIENIAKKSIIKLVEDQGIVVSSFDFNSTRVDSLTMLTNSNEPVIFINKSLLGDRQRFTIAYELGQLIMHTFTELEPGQDIDREASAFAAELLMPEEEIRSDFEEGINMDVLARLKKKWKVSMISLLYRADDLGFVSVSRKRYIIQQFNEQKIRRREPPNLDIAPAEPSLLKYRIGQFRARTKLSVVDTAALLCLQVDEFMEMYS